MYHIQQILSCTECCVLAVARSMENTMQSFLYHRYDDHEITSISFKGTLDFIKSDKSGKQYAYTQA